MYGLTNTLSRSQARWDSNAWALSLRSDFSPRVTAPYVGVIHQGKDVTKKELLIRAIFLCGATFIALIIYYGNVADSFASFLGYPVATILIPIFVSALIPFLCLLATDKNYTNENKKWLFVGPLTLTFIILLFLYVSLKYGVH